MPELAAGSGITLAEAGGILTVSSAAGGVATPADYGAVGNGTTDDTTALQAFWNAVILGTVAHDCSGVYGIASNVIIGPSVAIADPGRPIFGRMKLLALGAIPEMVRVRNLNYRRWIGGLFVKGIGSSSYASRTCSIGVYLENCPRLGFSSGIRADHFNLGGVWCGTANSNQMQLGMVETNCIGSGHAGGSLTGTWTSGAQTGSSGSTAQQQTINLSAFYSSALDTYLDVSGQNDPVHLRISGYLYSVKSINRGAGTAVIYPWLDPAAGSSGTFDWVFGGGVYCRVGDNSLVEINTLDANECGRALTVACPYGPVVNNLQANTCGTIALLGRNNSATCLGTLIKGFYAEGSTANKEHVVINTTIGASVSAQVLGDTGGFDLAKCWQIGDPRVTAGSISGGEFGATTAAAGSATISKGGRLLPYHKSNLNNLPGSTINLRGQIRNPNTEVYRKDTVTFLLNVEGSGEYNRLFGYSGGSALVAGTGTNGAPTGNVIFTPPSGGTINGGSVDATVTFAGFDGAALFSYEHTDTAQLTWLVRPLTGRSRYGLAGQATKGNADVTLTAYTDKITQRFTTTLTADRAVTLSTTGAVEANRFKIARPATGAFNLNVGTGPLKALAAGTWCEVEYDGSAWQLVANGSL